jgi:hypothetical protein
MVLYSDRETRRLSPSFTSSPHPTSDYLTIAFSLIRSHIYADSESHTSILVPPTPPVSWPRSLDCLVVGAARGWATTTILREITSCCLQQLCSIKTTHYTLQHEDLSHCRRPQRLARPRHLPPSQPTNRRRLDPRQHSATSRRGREVLDRARTR